MHVPPRCVRYDAHAVETPKHHRGQAMTHPPSTLASPSAPHILASSPVSTHLNPTLPPHSLALNPHPPQPSLTLHPPALCTQIDEPELSAYVRYLGYQPKKNEVDDMIWEALVSSTASTSASASNSASQPQSRSRPRPHRLLCHIHFSDSHLVPHPFLRLTPRPHPENALWP